MKGTKGILTLSPRIIKKDSRQGGGKPENQYIEGVVLTISPLISRSAVHQLTSMTTLANMGMH